jgi:hypothetical protein
MLLADYLAGRHDPVIMARAAAAGSLGVGGLA